MNSSAKTRIIAQGIAVYSAYQDLPYNKIEGSDEEREWLKWQQRWPQYVTFVQVEQWDLFDRVNIKLMVA